MEAPPQFPGAPKKSKTGLTIGLIALAICLCCCGICGFGAYLSKDVVAKGMGLAECSTALGLQRDGLLAYAEKNGGKLPAAGTWQDDIKPYVQTIGNKGEKNSFVNIPTPEEGVCDRGSKTTIAYNTAIAGKKVADLKEPYGTVALFEISGEGRNKSAAWKEPPFETSPIMVQNERRGWLRQPVQGPGFYIDKRGKSQAAPGINSANGVNVEVKESTPK